MSAQPEALRLAAALDAYWGAENGHDRERQAAAELRRLSIENEAFGLHLSERMKDLARVEAQRDALLEALRRHVELHDGDCICEDCAAIKAVEENT